MVATPVFRELCRSGAITHLTAKGVPGGFVLIARIGLEDKALHAQRGGARIFKSLDALAKYAARLGFIAMSVDLNSLGHSTLLLETNEKQSTQNL
jgi:hypothetical protein